VTVKIGDLHREMLRLMDRFDDLDRRSVALCLELDSLLPRPSLIGSLFRKRARPRRGIPFGIAWHIKFQSLVDEGGWLLEEMTRVRLDLVENRSEVDELRKAHQSLCEFVPTFSR
jgi:hypothetical protein